MKKNVLILLLLLSCINANARKSSYRTGDFIFQDLDCGGLCDAIEAVTQSYNGYRFSHVGLVYISHNDTLVIEAIGKEVQLTPLSSFLGRTAINLHGRLRKEYRCLITKAIDFSLAQKGTPYDDEFLYDNDKYYCSELLYDAFKYANKGQPFFELEPMTFRKPGTKDFFPVWIEYYNKLGIDIPEGKPGCNPGGLSQSGKIEIIR